MPVARLTRWGLALWCGLSLGLAACGGPADPANPGGDPGGSAATAAPGDGGEVVAAPSPTAGPSVPETVPVLASAYDLAVTADDTYIAYKAPETYASTVTFYQTELAAQGWEQINKNDAAFGGSTTLLRSRPEANISVTIQAVPGDDNAVRVLISLTKK